MNVNLTRCRNQVVAPGHEDETFRCHGDSILALKSFICDAREREMS